MSRPEFDIVRTIFSEKTNCLIGTVTQRASGYDGLYLTLFEPPPLYSFGPLKSMQFVEYLVGVRTGDDAVWDKRPRPLEDD